MIMRTAFLGTVREINIIIFIPSTGVNSDFMHRVSGVDQEEDVLLLKSMTDITKETTKGLVNHHQIKDNPVVIL